MKLWLIFLIPALACAQSISVTAPTTNQGLTGTFLFTVSQSGMPSLAQVEYSFAGQPRTWISLSDPWSVRIPVKFLNDGLKTVTATARDAFGTTLATSTGVAFYVKNTGEILTSSGLTGTVSGQVTWTVSARGAANWNCMIDGITAQGRSGITTPMTSAFTFPTSNVNVTVPDHGLWTGIGIITISTSGSGLPAGWSEAGELWARVIDKDKFTAHPTFADAIANTNVKTYAGNGSSNFRISRRSDMEWSDWQTSTNGPSSRTFHINTARLTNGTHTYYCFDERPDVSVAHAITAANVSASTGNWTSTSHRVTTGRPVILTTTGTLPTGFSLSTTYYGIYVDENNFRLAASLVNADAGTQIVPSDQGTGTHTATHTMHHRYWQQTSSWQKADMFGTFTVSNTAGTSMEMRPACKDCWLYVGGPTVTLAPFMANNDGTTTAITASSVNYSSSNTAVATITSGGIVAAVSAGAADIQGTYLTGGNWYTFASRIWVRTSNTFPHFTTSGGFNTVYTVGSSFFPTVEFRAAPNDINGLSPILGKGYYRASFRSLEEGLPAGASFGFSNISSFTTAWNLQFLDVKTSMNAWGLKTFWSGDNWAAGGGGWSSAQDIWMLPNTSASTGQKAAVKITLDDIKADARSWGVAVVDEVDSKHGSDPVPDGKLGSTHTFISLVVTGCPSTPCLGSATVNTASPKAVGDYFIIYSATTSGLNGSYKTVSRVSGTSFTFRTIDVVNGTYDNTNNANLQITRWPYSQDGISYPGVTIAGSGLTQLVKSSSTVTVTWTSHGMSTGQYIFVQSAVDTDFNNAYTITSTGANSFTFTVQSDQPISDGTYNSSTDPSLEISRAFFNPTYNNDSLSLFVTGALDQTSGRVPISWPTQFTCGTPCFDSWMSNATLQQFGHLYNDDGSGAGFGFGKTVYDGAYRRYINLATFRNSYLQRNVPMLSQVSNVGFWYWKQVAGPSMDELNDGIYSRTAVRPETITAGANLMLAWGSAGFRYYTIQTSTQRSVQQGLAIGTADENTQSGVRPWNQTPSTVGQWTATALENGLVKALEPLLLQPNVSSPYYSAWLSTGLKEGVTGHLLIIVNVGEVSQSPPVTLSTFTYGSTIIRYQIDGKRISVVDKTGQSSDTPTLTAGETVMYAFYQSATPLVTTTWTLNPAGLTGGTKAVIRYGYHDFELETKGEIADCGSGTCTMTYDPRIGNGLWARHYYLNSSNVILSKSDPYLISP